MNDSLARTLRLVRADELRAAATELDKVEGYVDQFGAAEWLRDRATELEKQ